MVRTSLPLLACFPLSFMISYGRRVYRPSFFVHTETIEAFPFLLFIAVTVLPTPRALKNHIFVPAWVTPSARRLFGQAPALTLRRRESACRQVPNLCGQHHR